MVKKTQWIWYRTNPDVEAAFLYNCRRRDLVDGHGIPKGTIVEGKNGLVVAEAAVPKVTGKIVAFSPNRRCHWQDMELSCMTNPAAPAGQPVPRVFNYIVAEAPDLETEKLSTRLGVPVMRVPGGKALMNLEIARFKNQGKNRRATLI